MVGELLPTAKSRFIILLQGWASGLGWVRIVIATWGLVVLALMQGCTRVRCSINSQCGYKVACSKGDEYLC